MEYVNVRYHFEAKRFKERMLSEMQSKDETMTYKVLNESSKEFVRRARERLEKVAEVD